MSYIHSIATGLPEHKYSREEIASWMGQVMPDDVASRKLNFILNETLIQQKYSCLPDFSADCEMPLLYDRKRFSNPTTHKRMEVFEQASVDLGVDVAERCLDQSLYEKEEITHIITVTCTGLSAPGLEILIPEKLGLSKNIQRHTVNFMGCYASFRALKLAHTICKADVNSKVLIVSVELCTLHFRNDDGNDNLLSTALFSDGAAAVVVSNHPANNFELKLNSFLSSLLPEGKDDMSWNIGNHGFEMVLNANVPNHILNEIGSAYHELVGDSACDFYAIHPGGKRILQAFTNGIGIEEEKLKESYEVLKEFGNMSSPTVLFVLEKVIQQAVASKKRDATVYSAAFGPGLTIEGALMHLAINEKQEDTQPATALETATAHA